MGSHLKSLFVRPFNMLRTLGKTISAHLDSRRLEGRFFKLVDKTKEASLLHNEREAVFRRLHEKIVAAGGVVVEGNARGEQIVVQAEDFETFPLGRENASWYVEKRTRISLIFYGTKISEHSFPWNETSTTYPEELFDKAIRALTGTFPYHVLCVG